LRCDRRRDVAAPWGDGMPINPDLCYLPNSNQKALRELVAS
jgi:hypothetical protein